MEALFELRGHTVVRLIEVYNAFPFVEFDYVDDRRQIPRSHCDAVTGVTGVGGPGEAQVDERHLKNRAVIECNQNVIIAKGRECLPSFR